MALPKPPKTPDPRKIVGNVQDAAGRARDALGKLPLPGRKPGPAELAAARLVVDKYLALAAKTPFGRAPEFDWVRDSLVECVLRGQDVDALRKHLAKKAEDVTAAHRPFLQIAERLGASLRQGDRIGRFRREVLLPANRRSLTSSQALARSSEISGLDLLRDVFGYDPRCTVLLGGAIEGGAVFGIEASTAIGGFLHGTACLVNSVVGAIGAYAKLSGSLQVSVNNGTPWDLGGGAFVVGVSAGYVAGAGVSVGWTPTGFDPSPHRDPATWIDWAWDGVAVDVGAVTGVEFSGGIEWSDCFTLPRG